jgi:transcriptional regulator with XRE-family HTH domain
MDNQQLNQIIVGNILKEQRESQGLSQIDVAMELGYKNYNYISMLENGRSNIPVKRVMDIVRAYKFEDSVIPVFIKKLLPNVWEIISYWIEHEPSVPTSTEELVEYAKKTEEKFMNLIDTFKLESYKPMIEASATTK